MLNSFTFPSWLNRQKFTLAFALIILLLGFFLPWYDFPSDTVEKFQTNLLPPQLGRILACIFIGLELVALLGFLRQNIRFLFWGGLILTFLFPYFVITSSPANGFLASNFTEQSFSVISHIESNFTEVQTQWKQNLVLRQINPVNSTLLFIVEDNNTFNLSSLYYWIESGLGYNNLLFWCMGKGWGLTLIGLLISLLGMYLDTRKEIRTLRIFKKDLIKLIPVFILSLILLLISLFLPHLINRELEVMYAKGQYSQVVNISQKLAWWYPSFGGDISFLERWAKASIYLKKPELPLVYLSLGLDYYRNNNFLQAQNNFEKVLQLQPQQFLARGYLANLLINQGVIAFNRNQPGVAISYFNAALEVFPNHINALYYLMLAHTNHGEFAQAALVGEKIQATQKYLQLPSLALLGQTYVHSAWSNYYQNNLDQAWEQYRNSVDKSNWK